jgi:hypothetical protein
VMLLRNLDENGSYKIRNKQGVRKKV